MTSKNVAPWGCDRFLFYTGLLALDLMSDRTLVSRAATRLSWRLGKASKMWHPGAVTDSYV